MRTATWLRAVAGVAAIGACGGPTGSSGSGAECVRDDQCNYGLVCALPTGGTRRVCTNDVAGLVAEERPDLPAAEPPVDPGTGGMAPVDPGTGGMEPVDPGTGGMEPVDPGTGGMEPVDPGTGGMASPGGAPGG